MSFIGNLFKTPKKPKAPTPPTVDSAAVQGDQEDAQRRALLGRGRSSTILTGNGGLGSVGQGQ